MREDLRLILVDAISDVKGRVFEPSVPGADEEKPFIVVREGVQESGDPYSNFATIVEVWPFVRQTSFQEVDRLSNKIIDTLHQKRFDSSTGEPFLVEYMGTAGDDVTNDEWKAITRGLRFQVYSMAWLVTNAVELDPAEAMRKWTEQRFPELQTNPETWQPSDDKPALYWRMGSVTGVERMNWGAWVDVRMIGHVLAPKAQTRVDWLKRIVPKLASDSRTYMTDGSQLLFNQVSADSTANPFRTGQIQLMARYGVLDELPDVPILEKAYVQTTDGAGGEVG